MQNEVDMISRIDEDEFREFLIEFHSHFESKENKKFNQVEVDIKKKFRNMGCNNTSEFEFLKFSAYFPIVNQIMDNPNYLDGDTKLIIADSIVTEYQKIFDDLKTGIKIIETMVDNMYREYKDTLKPMRKLRIYLKIMIYWSIQECDIFNEIKGDD